MKEDNFPFSPNRKEDECSFFVGVTSEKFKEQLKNAINGNRTENHSDGEG